MSYNQPRANHRNNESSEIMAKEKIQTTRLQLQSVDGREGLGGATEDPSGVGGRTLRAKGAGEGCVIQSPQEVVFIYGYRKGGKFLYVGQTVEPAIRHKKHIAEKRALRKLQQMILRKTSIENSDRIERQIVSSLQRRGECRLNKKLPTIGVPKVGGAAVYCKRTGLSFASVAQASRLTGISETFIKSGLRSQGFYFDGTYELHSPMYVEYFCSKPKLTTPRKEGNDENKKLHE